MESVKTSPYLNFNGNCLEAMEFYKSAVGGKLDVQKYKDAPMNVPDGHKDKVIHSRLEFDGGLVMAADMMPGGEAKLGNAIHILIDVKDPKVGERYFNNLAQGGQVTMPWAETFWGAQFGQLVDKFGIYWMVNCEKEGK